MRCPQQIGAFEMIANLAGSQPPRAVDARQHEVVCRYVAARTKVDAVSWVTFDDGYRHDLTALAEVAHAHGALFVVDAELTPASR